MSLRTPEKHQESGRFAGVELTDLHNRGDLWCEVLGFRQQHALMWQNGLRYGGLPHCRHEV